MIHDTIKYFGITIDNKLNFEEHINVLAPKTSRLLGALRILCHILPKSALHNLNQSIIHPHLLYRITVWKNDFDKYLKKLPTLQNKAVKLLSGAPWHDHVTPSNDLYSWEVAKLMHKHTQNKLPMILSTFFAPVKAIHTQSTVLV